MTTLIIEISKYFMILLMAFYTYFNFRFFSYQDLEDKKAVCGRQNQAMFLIHLLAFLVIYLKSQEEAVIGFYLAQVVFFVCYIGGFRLLYRNVSRLLVNNTAMLLCVGFIIQTRLSIEKGQALAGKQFAVAALAAAISLLIPFIMDRVWQLSKIPWVYGLGGLVLLAAVWMKGNTSYGAQLSLSLGGASFQPSEFVKITFVFFTATMFYHSTSFRTVCITTAVAAAHVLVLVASKDLGGALIFFTTYLFMLFVATSNWVYLGTGVLSGSVAAVAAYYLFSHVRIRVEAWANPWADIDNRGYQITQSLFAIGTGGWFGSGLFQGMPYKIPVVEKDFIFAAIFEEMGGIFAVCVLLICLGCFIQFMMIASKMRAAFYKLIAFGLGMVYITQVFLNVGGVVKFIPSTGVTLPFVSYGGSSVFSTFFLFHIVQGLYILKRNEEEEDEGEF